MALHYKLRDKPYQANHVLNVLSKLFSLAEAWGLAPPEQEPLRGPCACTRISASGS